MFTLILSYFALFVICAWAAHLGCEHFMDKRSHMQKRLWIAAAPALIVGGFTVAAVGMLIFVQIVVRVLTSREFEAAIFGAGSPIPCTNIRTLLWLCLHLAAAALVLGAAMLVLPQTESYRAHLSGVTSSFCCFAAVPFVAVLGF